MSTQDTMSAGDKLAAGRLMAVEKFRYFRSGIYGLIPRPAPGLGTFGTTKRGVMFYDPAICVAWSVDEICAVIVHELFHLLRDHAGRCDNLKADPRMFNVAGDEEINDDLENARLTLPRKPSPPVTCEYFRHPRGLTAEEYYRLLEKEQQQAGDEASEAGGNLGPAQPQAGGGWCGGAGGHPLPPELESATGTGTGGEDGKHADGRSDVELHRIRAQVAEAIRSEAAKGRGTVPASWIRWADGLLKPPKVRWQDRLAKLVRGSVAARFGAQDYRWHKPSRRQGALGYGVGVPILPALWAPTPRVAIAVDTSGSMGQGELERAVAECAGILKATGATVDFVACDAAVHAIKPVANVKELVKCLVGGGGTNFVPVFDALEKTRKHPDVLVFLTDGCGPAPEHPPKGFKTIWVLVGQHRARPCAWGEVVEIDEGGAE